MLSDTLLCFKACYCLGATDSTLQYEYPALMEVAKKCDYFADLKSTREFRAINYVFFYICRYRGQFAAGKSVSKTIGSELNTMLEGVDFNPDMMYADSVDLLDFLGKLAERSRKLIPAVYEELKPGIGFTSFELLTSLPTPTQAMFDSANYNMRTLPSGCNYYFFNKESLNLALKSMFKSDSALLKAVRIARGTVRDQVVDTSKLADEWNAIMPSVTEQHFLTVKEAGETGKSIVYMSADIEAATQSHLLEKFASTQMNMRIVASQEAFEAMTKEEGWKEDNTLLVCRKSKSGIDALIKQYPNLLVSVVMPMEQHLYKSILAGYYENVTIFSLR